MSRTSLTWSSKHSSFWGRVGPRRRRDGGTPEACVGGNTLRPHSSEEPGPFESALPWTTDSPLASRTSSSLVARPTPSTDHVGPVCVHISRWSTVVTHGPRPRVWHSRRWFGDSTSCTKGVRDSPFTFVEDRSFIVTTPKSVQTDRVSVPRGERTLAPRDSFLQSPVLRRRGHVHRTRWGWGRVWTVWTGQGVDLVKYRLPQVCVCGLWSSGALGPGRTLR